MRHYCPSTRVLGNPGNRCFCYRLTRKFIMFCLMMSLKLSWLRFIWLFLWINLRKKRPSNNYRMWTVQLWRVLMICKKKLSRKFFSRKIQCSFCDIASHLILFLSLLPHVEACRKKISLALFTACTYITNQFTFTQSDFFLHQCIQSIWIKMVYILVLITQFIGNMYMFPW